MATVSHTIYSRYAPKRRVVPNGVDVAPSADDPWDTENSFPIRQLREPPHFVPASLTGGAVAVSSDAHATTDAESGLASWYRSLTSAGVTPDSTSRQASEPPPGPSSHTHRRKSEAANKNNWFIQRAIQSEPVSAAPSPPPTLADILARDPPPLPTEAPYVAPVWLALGPSNKGFSMLQKSGWSEGEGLGKHAPRRRVTRKPVQSQRSSQVKREEQEVQWAEGVHEIRQVEVIDLTLSDSEDQHEVSDIEADEEISSGEDMQSREDNNSDPMTDLPAQGQSIRIASSQSKSADSQKILLTPIATTLKSDRLGIGLKAKTFGPHKASVKRVTHSAAAVAAYIRDAEALRKKKAEMGRGHRGFARAAKQEAERRKRMLAYLND
ncbi:hypothetical protein HWV62_2982 [Athelia sp. TMB]|nr:hypothetical protein HWV62_2982 [Athelia sp. TMB]